MKKIQSAKGYRDPTDDCESAIFPVEQPCHVLNLADDMEALIPLKAWKEKWKWSRIKPIFSENWTHLQTWLGEVAMSQSKPSRFNDQYGPFYADVSLNGLKGIWGEPLWMVSCRYSGYKMEETWETDEENQWSLRKMVETWSTITGHRDLLSTRQASNRSEWEIVIRGSSEAISDEAPVLRFGLGRGGDNDRFAVPGPQDGTISEFYSGVAERFQTGMAVDLFEAAIFSLFGGDPVPDSITYKPKNEDVPAFREWAVPAFGGPWLQYILGFATERANADDITDGVPAWSLYVVGYFKLLRSRRCVLLQKEPGGWRLLLTGRTVSNPERHRFLREEIARMAGMTSETLWEPQEAGGGWLGVPG